MESDSDDEEHSHVGDYVLGGVIGEGSYGKVRDAMQRNGLRVAIKKLSMGRVKRAKAMQMVRHEIEITKHLMQYPHKNVVKVSEVIEDTETTPGRVYFVMELIKGGSLKYLLDNSPDARMELSAMRSYFTHLMHGLAHIHEKGIVHRDIKPENLMITISGVAKICDFGVAERLDLFGNEGQPILLQTKGTPQFQAPEIASGVGSVCGTAVDVWSAGITLWNGVFGTYPFNGNTLMQLYDSIVENEPALPTDPYSEQDQPFLFDLLQGMLFKSEKDRLSVQQVLSHPWITGGAAAGAPVDQTELFPIQLPQVGSISMLRKLSGLYSEEHAASPEATQAPSAPAPAASEESQEPKPSVNVSVEASQSLAPAPAPHHEHVAVPETPPKIESDSRAHQKTFLVPPQATRSTAPPNTHVKPFSPGKGDMESQCTCAGCIVC